MTSGIARYAMISGASSGFGLDVALALARSDWTVFATVRKPINKETVLAAGRSEGLEARLKALQLDVTDQTSIQAAVSFVRKASGGGLDLLVNNAGYTDAAFFEDMTDEQCRAIMETNFFGAVALTRCVLPMMRASRRGRIAFVSSNAVNTPHPTMTMYAASKWAMEGFAEGLAMEVAPLGIEVVVLQPGNHRTPFGSKVKVTRRDDSEYSSIWDKVLPCLGKVAAIGADPAIATKQIVETLTSPRPRFLTQIGQDTRFFSALKRTGSYETRAKILRRFVKFPGNSPVRSP